MYRTDTFRIAMAGPADVSRLIGCRRLSVR